MERLDEAIRFFQRAIELAPTTAIHYESLAIGYGMLGHIAEAIHQINRSREHAGESTLRADIYEQALLRNPEKLLRLLHAAFETDQISKIEMKRDPNINLLLDLTGMESLLDSL
jgi:tetratricopeptide (TPR) repeat protein